MMNPEVTDFLEQLNHPMSREIEQLRKIILSSHDEIQEAIKWNGPNYTVNGQDRITIRVNPPKSIHLILHTGAKVQAQPQHKLIENDFGLLTWKTNDRAIVEFKKSEDFAQAKVHLKEIVSNWLTATI